MTAIVRRFRQDSVIRSAVFLISFFYLFPLWTLSGKMSRKSNSEWKVKQWGLGVPDPARRSTLASRARNPVFR